MVDSIMEVMVLDHLYVEVQSVLDPQDHQGSTMEPMDHHLLDPELAFWLAFWVVDHKQKRTIL